MLDQGFAAYLTRPLVARYVRDIVVSVLEGSQSKTPAVQHGTSPESESRRDTPQSRYRILLVEDNAVNRRVSGRILEKAGYSYDVACDGKEALEAVAHAQYDLILMDCRLPRMDGFQATAEIRRHETEGRRTPIIAMTADAVEGTREKCLAAGMDEYVVKPVTMPGLMGILERYLRSESVRV
jgi:CheY-like chemotaxis protein